MGKKGGLLSLAVLVLCVSLCYLGIQASKVYAGENYGSHYPGGNEDFMAGGWAPPGTQFFMSYLVDYNASTLNNNSGRSASLTTGVPAGAPPFIPGPRDGKVDFNLNVFMDALRYLKITKYEVLGGNLSWHVIIPVGYDHVTMNAINGFSLLGPSSKTGIGDIEAGMGIGWRHSNTLSSVLAFDIVAPTGQYSVTGTRYNYVVDPASLGRNYWSFDPIYLITYIGGKDSPVPGLELSAKFMYWINTVNSATSYVSGQEFSADYLIGYHPSPQWAIGANGFYRYQLTDDTQYGKTAVDPLTGIATGVRGNVWSIGPAISYNIPHGCLTLKWQHDIYAQNGPEGDKVWLRWIYVF
jgi:hypothetical protein